MRFDAERHHRRSIRLPAYDYAAGGTFFVTICTHDREVLFGWVDTGAMRMNEFGWIVWEEWERSAQVRPGMELIAHVVMPNHMHAVIGNTSFATKRPPAGFTSTSRRTRSAGRAIAKTPIASR
jgi:REP element-mobilizing transposase RayT